MATFQAPKFHKEIIDDFLEGKFLIYSDSDKFETVCKEKVFYKSFFEESYGYKLNLLNEFAYLTSRETDEKFSVKFTVFLSIICYEFNKQTDDIGKKIKSERISCQEIEDCMKSNTFEEVVRDMGFDKLVLFLDQLAKRNIIQFIDNEKRYFRFTVAVNLFFEFAINLSNKDITEY